MSKCDADDDKTSLVRELEALLGNVDVMIIEMDRLRERIHMALQRIKNEIKIE